MTWRSLPLLALLGCVPEPAVPYVRTQPVGGFHRGWFYDGPPLVIRVVNPLPVAAVVSVQCASGEPPYHSPDWDVTLGPGEEVAGIGQALNRDSYGEPCWVSGVRAIGR
jgi:hypothetical protein